MPIAYDMRPISLKDFVGQEHLIGKGGIIRRMIEHHRLFSLILWGPPGVGKTTLAHILANSANAKFKTLSGVTSGKKDLMNIVHEAQTYKNQAIDTVLFIDEIHRWNKAQQDALLPYVESNTIFLIGATTENPSFEVIPALLSRMKVFVLNELKYNNLKTLVKRALTNTEKGLGKYKKNIENSAQKLLIKLSGGDARIVLNALEIAVKEYKNKTITTLVIKDIFQKGGIYDKGGQEHYNTISAYIKSVRASDADASLYYLMRMLEAGEDPKFIARRMIILASEDIGLADRGALIQANEAFSAVEKIGMPEAQLILAHVTVYLAKAKKSRAIANAVEKAKQLTHDFPNLPIPLHLRNAPTKLMKEIGYAKDYIWSEKYVGVKGKLSLLPKKIENEKILKD